MTRSWGALFVGLAFVVVGIAWLLAVMGVTDVSPAVVLAVALILVGIGVATSPPGAGRGGLIALGILLALVAAAAATVDPRLLSGGVGERRETPRSAAELRHYELAIGRLVVDLTSIDPPASLRASVGVGEVVVVVDESVAVELDGEIGVGEIDLRGQKQGGIGVSLRRTDGSGASLELDVRGGVGRIVVGGEELDP